MIKAILYDMDGVIVNSEGLSMKIKDKTLREHGIILSQKELEQAIGVTDRHFYVNLFKTKKIKLNVDTILNKYFSQYDKFLPKVKVLPGVIASIKRFKPEYKLAIVSGSTPRQINIVLRKIGMKKYFDVILSCDDFKNSKPHPEPYLTGAKRLKVKPSECIVLEDAPPGIKSGKAAGMYVIGIKIGNKGKLNISQADLIVNTLKEVTLEKIKRIV